MGQGGGEGQPEAFGAVQQIKFFKQKLTSK